MYMCVSLDTGLGVGRVGMLQKIFNAPSPVLKAGDLVLCSCVSVSYLLCGLVRWVSFLFFLSSLASVYMCTVEPI